MPTINFTLKNATIRSHSQRGSCCQTVSPISLDIDEVIRNLPIYIAPISLVNTSNTEKNPRKIEISMVLDWNKYDIEKQVGGEQNILTIWVIIITACNNSRVTISSVSSTSTPTTYVRFGYRLSTTAKRKNSCHTLHLYMRYPPNPALHIQRDNSSYLPVKTYFHATLRNA